MGVADPYLGVRFGRADQATCGMVDALFGAEQTVRRCSSVYVDSEWRAAP